MKTSDFNKVFEIDFNNLPKFREDRPSVWGNVSNDDLVEVCFKKLGEFFPECSKTSSHFAYKVKITIGLAFMRINENGDSNCPNFADFLICSMMSVTQKDIKNEYDKRLYINLNKLNLSGEISLAS